MWVSFLPQSRNLHVRLKGKGFFNLDLILAFITFFYSPRQLRGHLESFERRLYAAAINVYPYNESQGGQEMPA